MYTKLTLPFLLSCLISFSGFGQLFLEDIICHGIEGDEKAKEAIPTRDGGWLLLGEVTTPQNSVQVLVIRLDEDDNLVWTNQFGGEGYDLPEDIIEAPDGSIFISAYTTSGTFGRRDYYILHLDANGNLINETIFGTAGDDAATLIRQIDASRLLITGLSYADQRESDIYFYQWDTSLSAIDEIRLPLAGSESLWDACDNTDKDGWMMAGQTTGTSNGEKDFFLVSTTREGKVNWYRNYGGVGDDRAFAIDRFENGYVMAGFSTSQSPGIRNGFVQMVDEAGNDIWNLDLDNDQTLEIHGLTTYGSRIVVTGFIFNPQTGDNLYLAEINANGQLIDKYELEAPLVQQGKNIFIKDNKLYVFGEKDAEVDKDLTLFVFSWEPLSNRSLDKAQIVELHPNPTSDRLFLTSDAPSLNWIIFDEKGKEALSGSGHELEVTQLPIGSYFIQIVTSNHIQSLPFVITR